MYYPYVKSQHPFRVLDGGPEGIVSADLLIWGMADIADQVAGDSVTKHRHIVELHNTPWGSYQIRLRWWARYHSTSVWQRAARFKVPHLLLQLLQRFSQATHHTQTLCLAQLDRMRLDNWRCSLGIRGSRDIALIAHMAGCMVSAPLSRSGIPRYLSLIHISEPTRPEPI
eukprot:6683011-Pyramimonas_sp.AAC.1